MTAGEARGYLARFLFRGDDVFKEVRALSGGERSRLELALLGIMPANLLLLDEPTNHLDIPAREAIEAFMRGTPATLLVVSHDRRLLETICDRLWVVDGGPRGAVRRRLPGVAGGGRRRLDASTRPSRARRRASTAGREARRAQRRGRDGRAGRRADGARRAAPGWPRPHAPAPRPARAGRRAQAKLSKDAYRRQKALVDADLTRLGLRKSHLELALGDPSIAANFVELRRVTSELADVGPGPRRRPRRPGWLLEERAP